MWGLTILQPWASLLAHGIKEFETRPMPYWKRLQDERIAIHAGKGRAGLRLLPMEPALRAAVQRLPHADDLPSGAIIATARLSWQMHTHGQLAAQQSAEEHALGDWRPGRWAWAFADMKLLPSPISCAGQQGFWRVPEHILERVECAA